MTNTEKPWAIILAAGQGQRLAPATGGMPKQFLNWQNMPLFWHSARTMSQASCIGGIVFVFPTNVLEEQRAEIQKLQMRHNLGIPFVVAPGGDLRQDSVRNGLKELPANVQTVLVHDAARPFLSARLVRNIVEALHNGAKAVIPALPVTDTIKRIQNDTIVKTLRREELVAVQTPQGFERTLLETAHQNAARLGFEATDDAAMIEAMGESVVWILGEARNQKLTRPEDLELMLQQKAETTTVVGMGYDVHRYGEGRPMKLGGVAIENAPQVVAHSDGDVLLHALMDALLGCACMGDIGQHFPDSDGTFENISSAILLDKVLSLLHEKGLHIIHVDTTIIAQKPRLASYRDGIRSNLARLLSLDKEHVNVKATTEEGLGFTGRLEGIKACVVATCEAPK